jgi:hypothetical protein
MSNRFLPLLILLVACGREDHRPAPAPTPAARPALAHSAPTDLASEIKDADRLGTWHEIESRWKGQDLRWTVTRQQVLCGSETRCNVSAFPIQRPAKKGWMPQLSFAPGQYALLDAACGKARDCELTFEGTLSEVFVSPELPTKISFTNVRVIHAGPANG